MTLTGERPATAARFRGEGVVMAWCGPDDHGVTLFGRRLFDAALALGFGGSALVAASPAALPSLLDTVPLGTRLVHLQVNDWLFADSSSTARDRLLDVASRLRRRGVALSVTFHDLPHTEVSASLYRRRAATYAAVAAVAAGVVVSSRHEAELLTRAVSAADPTATPPTVTVIPLPVAAGPAPARPAPPALRGDTPTVGVFGFLYPGKGHVEVIEELAGIQPAVRLLAIGRASTGHEHLLGDLGELARVHGIDFATTGYVPDEDVDVLLRSVDVPVAPAAQVSASGSINSWITAGRRPLALAGDYTREIAARRPDCLRLYAPGELRELVLAALADPESTWLPRGAVTGPGPAVVARRYVDWLRATAAAAC
ncbi:glycosyltransferase [Nakamurella deserti]|uniref:glycosyltransferase n=1 Tax=Nakamurella deserti TaxID=2164074 RepID=UPI000DBE4072|nr:glycosyltransferase [Nakamurella deserti]